MDDKGQICVSQIQSFNTFFQPFLTNLPPPLPFQQPPSPPFPCLHKLLYSPDKIT